jgi:hypothetical protein
MPDTDGSRRATKVIISVARAACRIPGERMVDRDDTGRNPASFGVVLMMLCGLAACEPQSTPPTAPAAPGPSAAAPFSGVEINLSAQQLETLVGRIALYPDDLVAVVLPASTQPVQVVEAHRLLEQRKSNPQAQPPRTWAPSVFALLNYPEVLALMNADLTWTEQLGTSVINQQAAVMDAVQSFRKKALDAGNLKSNDKQTVTAANQVVVIQPASPEVVYVPSYNPTTVVYESPGYPYPYYWSAPYPYYYSPYAPYYTGAAYGVSVGFTIGWYEHDIYHDDIHIDEADREAARQRVEERRTAREENRPNRENVWQPDRTARDRAGTGAASALAGTDRSRAGAGAGAADLAREPRSMGTDRGRSAEAFSGVDHGAAASRYAARGSSSMAGRGGGFGGGRGGGGGGRGGRR